VIPRLIARLANRLKHGGFIDKFMIFAAIGIPIDVLFRLRDLTQPSLLLVLPVLLAFLLIRSIIDALVFTLIFHFVLSRKRNWLSQ
jgi:hypothetical protein